MVERNVGGDGDVEVGRSALRLATAIVIATNQRLSARGTEYKRQLKWMLKFWWTLTASSNYVVDLWLVFVGNWKRG